MFNEGRGVTEIRNSTAFLSLLYLPDKDSHLFSYKDNLQLNLYYTKASGKIQCFYNKLLIVSSNLLR